MSAPSLEVEYGYEPHDAEMCGRPITVYRWWFCATWPVDGGWRKGWREVGRAGTERRASRKILRAYRRAKRAAGIRWWSRA